jgi:hypothetical protein
MFKRSVRWLKAWLFLLVVVASALPASAQIRPLGAAETMARVAGPPFERVEGVFEIEVRGSGRDGKWYFLNSEADYRDPACLTFAVGRGVFAQVKTKLGGDFAGLHGKRVVAEGVAQRKVIWYTDGRGRRTGGYYYQTHVWIASPEKIWLAE